VLRDLATVLSGWHVEEVRDSNQTGSDGGEGRMDDEMIEAFRPELVQRITGLSARRLRRLEELGIVQPSVAPREPGWPPLYSFHDLIRLRLAAELLGRDFNAPEVKRLVDELEARGFEDPLVSVGFVGDPNREGRAFLVYPGTTEPRSARHVDQHAEMFDLELQVLRQNLMGTIEQLTRRQPGHVEKVRGVQGGAPVVAGTRVPTDLVARLVRAGWSRDRVRESYPILEDEDIDAALRHEGVSQAVA